MTGLRQAVGGTVGARPAANRPIRHIRHIRPTRQAIPGLLLAIGALTAAPAVQAADAKAKSPADKIMTPAQLRDCLAQRTKMRQQEAESVKQRQALDTEKADIARVGDTLQAQLATLDRTNAEAVAAYNDQVQAQEKRIDAYQAGVEQYNAKIGSLQADHDAIVRSCDNRRFLEDDETAIKKGK